MGKKIDLFVLTAGITIFIYFYFFNNFKNRLAAALLALLFCMLLRKIAHTFSSALKRSSFAKKHSIRRRASSAMMCLACMDKDEAGEKISKLLGKTYATDCKVELIQAHPSANVDENTIFNVWKQHRGLEKLAICITCRSDIGLRAFAASFKEPKLAIIDSAALTELIAEHPCDLMPPEEKAVRHKLRLHYLGSLFFNRKNASKCLLTSFSMIVVYVFTSNTLYLLVALVLIFFCCISLRKHGRPAKLF